MPILYVEAAAYHRERFAAHPDKFGVDIQVHIPRGLAIPAVEYADALHSLTRLRAETDSHPRRSRAACCWKRIENQWPVVSEN